MSKDSMLTYIVGFVHGRSDLLRELLFAIDRDARKLKEKYRVFFLGNLIDAGPDSRGALELALHTVGCHPGSGIVRGFHENRLLQILDEKDDQTRMQLVMHWFKGMKGEATLASYGLVSRPTAEGIAGVIDARHIALLRRAKRYFELDDHIIVHAGISPGVHILDQNLEPNRRADRSFVGFRGDHGKVVVYGASGRGRLVEAFPNRIAINSFGIFNLISALRILPGGNLHALAARGRLSRGIQIIKEDPILEGWTRNTPAAS